MIKERARERKGGGVAMTAVVGWVSLGYKLAGGPSVHTLSTYPARLL